MKKRTSAIILISFIVVVLVATIIIALKDSPKEIATIPYRFAVKDNLGINLDSDSLQFGGGVPGVILQRSLNISAPFDAVVHIESEGPGKVMVDQNDFFLFASTQKELLFSLIVPADLALGDYEGTVYISFYES
ncbi:MAG: hypothetical protein KC535_01825 [Nanoarchaeota archaeon]|nr:hypothetical protein [Nanoarchaeota archaeon]